MADPFNPRRFFYETNSQSDLRNDSHIGLANADPQTPRRAEAFRPSQDGSVLRLRSGPPTSTVPQPGIGTQLIQRHVEPINPSDRHTDTRSGRRDLLIPLCVAVVAVVAVSCYFGIRALECFPHPTPFASLSPDVQAYVDQAILRISRDPVGRPDFALYANGGRVIPELTGIVRDDVLVLPSTDNSPNLSLSDDPRIGSCWKFPQDAGQLGFRTSEILFPTHVTIDHIPIDVAVDIGQAPRSMVLWGAVDGRSNLGTLHDILGHTSPDSDVPTQPPRSAPPFTANLTFIMLAAFEYDIYSPNNTQTFALLPLIVQAHMSFGVFVLDIFGNWGGDATCLYRIRVHGESTFQ